MKKLLTLTEFGNPILRHRAKSVPLSYLKTKEFKELEQQMIHTMRKAQGVGLAAPQVGVPLRIAVMEMRKTPTRPDIEHKGPITIINPVIKKFGAKTEKGWEGCLSLEHVRGEVGRSASVAVEYINSDGTKVVEHASGLWARIFQHEIDHLDGVVYVDRMHDMKTLMTVGEFKRRVLKSK